MPGGGPVAMTVEQGADDAAAQHAVERLVLLARLPLGDDLVAVRKAAHVQTLRIRRSTTKASEIRRVSFLNALHNVCRATLRGRPARSIANDGGGHGVPPLQIYTVNDRNCWRSLKRWILPVAVYGSSGTNMYIRGCLKRGSDSAASLRNSCSN